MGDAGLVGHHIIISSRHWEGSVMAAGGSSQPGKVQGFVGRVTVILRRHTFTVNRTPLSAHVSLSLGLEEWLSTGVGDR